MFELSVINTQSKITDKEQLYITSCYKVLETVGEDYNNMANIRNNYNKRRDNSWICRCPVRIKDYPMLNRVRTIKIKHQY